MNIKENKKNKLTDLHKMQLENHKEIFPDVKPIITQDGKDQGHQNIKVKKENKIIRAISKLFGVSNKNSQKVVAYNEIQDAMEKKIKQMNSKEVLEFLNTDEIQPAETSDKGNVKVNSANIENQIEKMDSKQILQLLNTDGLSNKKTAYTNAVATKEKKTVSWSLTIGQINRNNKGKGI